MVRVGLISEHQTKPRAFFRREYKKEIILNEKNPFELVVVTVPFSKAQLEHMSERRKKRVIGKAVSLLNQGKVTKVFLSTFLKENVSDIFLAECGKTKNFLFEKWAYLCVKEFSKKCGMPLLDANICIRDTKMERISENLIGQLCYDAKCVTVFTENIQKAQSVRERLLDETGMHVKILNGVPGNDADVVIDVDKAEIRIGRNLIIDGVSVDFDFNGYEADFREITACICELVNFDRNLLFFSGKKKLTL